MPKRAPDIDESLREKTLDGRKTCFIRPFPYLDVGDTFEIFGATFTVTGLGRKRLEEACRSSYCEAGYDSYEQLRSIWVSSHRHFDGESPAVVHWFKRTA